LREAVARLGELLFELYSCTEGVGTVIKPTRIQEKPGSVGVAILGTRIAILGDDDQIASRGVIGEIIGYGPGLMKCYHKRPDATAEVTWRDGRNRTWLKTGDIGRLDEDGYLTILDRNKDMIVSGGFNVYATDIEQVIADHPQVAEVAVIGIPHPRWSEVPLAVVIARLSLDEADLVEWTNARLAKHQRIVGVRFHISLPRNALGKILKRELREQVTPHRFRTREWLKFPLRSFFPISDNLQLNRKIGMSLLHPTGDSDAHFLSGHRLVPFRCTRIRIRSDIRRLSGGNSEGACRSCRF